MRMMGDGDDTYDGAGDDNASDDGADVSDSGDYGDDDTGDAYVGHDLDDAGGEDVRYHVQDNQ